MTILSQVDTQKELRGINMKEHVIYNLRGSGLFVFFILFLGGTLNAQETRQIKDKLTIPDSTTVQIVKTKDGSTLIGRIIEINENDIQFETNIGNITIPIAKIEDIKETPVTSIKDGKYWYPNPNSTRLYFSPTGRMLKKGEGYFSDYYLFFPGIAYGVSDNVTMGGGVSLIPGVDFENQIFFFTPKIGIKATENANFAAGALIIRISDFGDDQDDIPIIGILYGVGTFGTADKSFTIGIGYGFVDSDLAEKPMIVLGGESRVSRRVALVTENWILPGVDSAILSYGIRFFGEKISVDLAFLNTTDSGIFPGVPYLDFVIKF